jgi:hypothetical protein
MYDGAELNRCNPVSKRVYVTLPDAIYEDLEQWANSQGRAVANLTAFLIETVVTNAKEEGKIPPKKPPTKGKEAK